MNDAPEMGASSFVNYLGKGKKIMFLNNLNREELMNEDPLLKELGYSCVVLGEGSCYFCHYDGLGNRRIIGEFGKYQSMYRALYCDLSRQKAKWAYVNRMAEEHNNSVTKFQKQDLKERAKELAVLMRRYVGTSERVALGAAD